LLSTAAISGSCAALLDGTLRCWGANDYGQLGDNSQNPSNVPVKVVGIATAVQVAKQPAHACAADTSGKAWCWGRNAFGELGIGTNLNAPVPIAISRLPMLVLEVAAGTAHTCALLNDDSVYCWGQNIAGGLGDGTTNDSNVPLEVSGL
jgi:alpha-tubulin suppressor-like RCC1 family protein